MVADALLPVWSIRPNWKDGILERLGWLTDVLPSTYGPEQRRALRVSPRRSFEINFNGVNESRSYFDLWLHRLGSQEFMLPLFHDKGRLTAAIAIGATTIPFDTTNREFAVGELAILMGDDPFVFDKVTIQTITATEITVLAGEVTQAWPKGAAIHPLRRSRLSQESAAAALTNRVGQATLEFQLNQANDIADEGVWDLLYGGHPILLDKPNWREQRDLTFLRNSLMVDNEHGLSYLGDDAGRAFTVDTHSRMIRGRAEHKAFRQFLYRLRGQQGAIWVPTFNRDFALSRAALAADMKLDVNKIGYAYTGGAVSGRRHVLLNNSIMKEVSGVGTAPSTVEERLNTSAAIGTALPVGTTGSFMDTCRLAQDDIEITHHTDTDGVAECNLSFRSFRDERVAPVILEHLIPVTAENDTFCGTPAAEDADCVNLDAGWLVQVRFDFTHGVNIPVAHAGINIWFQDVNGANIQFSYTNTSDGEFWAYDGVGNYTDPAYGQTATLWKDGTAQAPNGGYPVNLFSGANRPRFIYLAPIQFQFGAFGCGGGPATGCGGLAVADFRYPNDVWRRLVVSSGEDTVGATVWEIERLWPKYVTFEIPNWES